MKTSDKILLGTFLAIMLILTGVHLALYAKIKSGDFAPVKEIDSHSEHHALPGIKYVSITGLVRCQLAMTGKPGMEIEKVPGSKLSFKLVNDTLYLNGDSTATKEDYNGGKRNYQMVDLTLPASVQIKLSYGTLGLFGGDDLASAPSWSIELASDAHLHILQTKSETAKAFFKQLKLTTNRSSVELNDNTVVDSMQVHTVASHLQYRNSQINQLTMDIDSSSTVAMQEKQIKNLTVISKP